MNDWTIENEDLIIAELDMDRADGIIHRYARDHGVTYTAAKSDNNSFHVAAVGDENGIILSAVSMQSADDAFLKLARLIKEQ